MIKVIDLFCGCGGFSEGFKQAGFDVVMAVDLWPIALESHKLNHIETEHRLCDIKTMSIDDLPSADVLIGSPPCQSFSVANLNTRTMDTSLIDKFMEFALSGRFKYWCWENVPSAYTSIGLQSYHVVDCAYYNAPSHRKRKFCCNFPFPAKISKPITIGDALKDLHDDGEGLPSSPDPDFLLRPNVISWMKTHPRQKMTDEMRTITTRVARDKRILHPVYNRPFTVAEVQRLMGFPDDYALVGSLSDKYMMLGNAVPPPTARVIAESISVIS